MSRFLLCFLLFDHLADLRRGLRERMRASPITDAAAFARRLGEAYRRMWQAAAAPGARNNATDRAEPLVPPKAVAPDIALFG